MRSVTGFRSSSSENPIELRKGNQSFYGWKQMLSYSRNFIIITLLLLQSYNLGLTDLFAALIWVSSNIEHFGGDPSLVTLLGWGAGADLVNSLTTSK